MVTTEASATWNGKLAAGDGTVRSPTLDEPYSFAARFEGRDGLNPEELVGAALSSCYAMALAHGLAEEGHDPRSVEARARVTFDPDALAIPTIELAVEGRVPGIDGEGFRAAAEAAKDGCPVSKALSGVEISLTEARLAGSG